MGGGREEGWQKRASRSATESVPRREELGAKYAHRQAHPHPVLHSRKTAASKRRSEPAPLSSCKMSLSFRARGGRQASGGFVRPHPFPRSFDLFPFQLLACMSG